MGPQRWRYIVIYDIVNDKRRNKVARILGGYGDRVQYSVFECVLHEKQFEALWEELADIVETTEDSVRAYRLCATCESWTLTLGPPREVTVPEVYVA